MASMFSVVLAPLDALETSLNALTTSLTTSATFASAPSTAQDLLAADDALASALATLRHHQDNYGRILRLNDEARRLQEQIRGIVRTCGALRAEVGDISPSILDSDSEDEDEEGAGKIEKDVDYETLLAFAARIGKHNAVAAREAEQEFMRRKVDAHEVKSQHSPPPLTNGTGITSAGTITNGQPTEKDGVALPQESQLDLDFLDAQVAAERAAKGMAFPPPDLLRNGALGQLQLAREQGGEDAVDVEVERWIRDAEKGGMVKKEKSTEKVGVGAPARREEQVPSQAQPQLQPQNTRPQRRPSHAAARPALPTKKLQLDMWDGDSDEDDD